MIRYLRRWERAVGELGNEQALSPGAGINVQEVFSDKNFSSRVEQPEASSFGDLIQDATMLLIT